MSATANLENLLTDKWNMALSFKAFVDYAQKNVDRMKENYEKTEISPALAADVQGSKKEARLLVLSADWCGDAVQNIPSVARLVDMNKKLQLRVLDRDRHDDLMQHFLTNGGKAIPIVIVAASNMRSYGVWGPRPKECQKIMTENKGKMPKEEIVPKLREWYAKDKNQSVLAEVWELIKANGQVVENPAGLRV